MADNLRHNKIKFLNKQFWSYNDEQSGLKDMTEIMEDRNIYTKKRYKNIFQLRHIKLKYMIEYLPKKVKHCILIRYEDLRNHFNKTMISIKRSGLKIKPGIKFPINTDRYKKSNKKFVISNDNPINKNKIINHPSFRSYYEKKLSYI